MPIATLTALCVPALQRLVAQKVFILVLEVEAAYGMGRSYPGCATLLRTS